VGGGDRCGWDVAGGHRTGVAASAEVQSGADTASTPRSAGGALSGAVPSSTGHGYRQASTTVLHHHRLLAATTSTGFLPLPISAPPRDDHGDVRPGTVIGARRNWTASEAVQASAVHPPGAENGDVGVSPSSRPTFGTANFNSTCVGPLLGGVLRELASPPSSSDSGGDHVREPARPGPGLPGDLARPGVDREVVCSLVNAPSEKLVSELNIALAGAGIEQVPVARRICSAGPRLVVDCTKLLQAAVDITHRMIDRHSRSATTRVACAERAAETPRSEGGANGPSLEDTQARTPDVTYVKTARPSPSECSPCDTDEDGPGRRQDAAARQSAEYKLAALGAQVRELEHCNRKLERRMARLVKALEDSNEEVHRLKPCYAHAQVLAEVCAVLHTDFDGAVGAAEAAVCAAVDSGATAAFSNDAFRIVSEMARSHGAPETFSHADALSKIRAWAAAADESCRFEQFRKQVARMLGGVVQTDEQILSEVRRLCGSCLPPENEAPLILSRVMEILRVVDVDGVVPALCALERRHRELENFWKTLCSAADQDFRKATLTSLAASLRIDLCSS